MRKAIVKMATADVSKMAVADVGLCDLAEAHTGQVGDEATAAGVPVLVRNGDSVTLSENTDGEREKRMRLGSPDHDRATASVTPTRLASLVFLVPEPDRERYLAEVSSSAPSSAGRRDEPSLTESASRDDGGVAFVAVSLSALPSLPLAAGAHAWKEK